MPFYHRAARQSNLRWLRYIIGDDSDHKVSLMMAWAGKSSDVSDPWYTGDFAKAYDDILEGCQAMLKQI